MYNNFRLTIINNIKTVYYSIYINKKRGGDYKLATLRILFNAIFYNQVNKTSAYSLKAISFPKKVRKLKKKSQAQCSAFQILKLITSNYMLSIIAFKVKLGRIAFKAVSSSGK